MQRTIEIRSDDLSGEATRRLIAFHLAGMHDTSPPDSVHALDIDALRHPSVSVWSAWVDGELAGVGALKALGDDRGEIKSMRVDDRFLGLGVGRALLRHVMSEARRRGMASLWLETGSTLSPITLVLRLSNSDFTLARYPSSVVQIGVKSFGCENRTPHESPSHS